MIYQDIKHHYAYLIERDYRVDIDGSYWGKHRPIKRIYFYENGGQKRYLCEIEPVSYHPLIFKIKAYSSDVFTVSNNVPNCNEPFCIEFKKLREVVEYLWLLKI